jgi:hypothetical protein
MPKVTVEYTDEEKAALNAEGRARGVADCPACGDSLLWKPGKEVVYGRGPTGTIPDFVGEQRPAVGDLGLTVLCQQCWDASAEGERVAHYAKKLGERRKAVRSVYRERKGGELVEDAEDRKRFDREVAEADAEAERVLKAVRGAR